MATKKTIIIDFNTRCSELINMFPLEIISRAARTKYSIGIKANAMIGIEQFICHVLQHRQKIEDRDEEFFQQNDYEVNNVDANNIINLIKSASLSFTPEEKQTYWIYMDMLVSIADNYVDLIIK